MLEDLERNLEGFAHSVKTVVREAERGNLSGIHGPVSRLLQVPEQYAVAIETGLGSSMQHVVCDTEENAKRAIALLKRQDGGGDLFAADGYPGERASGTGIGGLLWLCGNCQPAGNVR